MASVEGLEMYAAITSGAPGWQKRAFERYRGLVYSLLIKSLGPSAELPDLMSDVFVTFFESAGRIRSASAVKSYLISITMNLARAELRRKRRRGTVVTLTNARAEVDLYGLDDPKANAALIQLARILDELDEDERVAFVLHGLEDMPVHEIAAVLKVSLSTAKRRVQRANEHVLKRVSRNALLADYVRDPPAERPRRKSGMRFKS